MNENQKYISRSKVRDSSELTAIRQAKSSALKIPQLVQGTAQKVDAYGVTTSCCATTVTKGKGTNMEYLNVLQAAQGCAICADNVGTDVLPGFYVSTFTTYDRSAPPFAQKRIDSNTYTSPCKVAEPVQYFPPFLQRGDTNNYTEQGVHDPANRGTTVSHQYMQPPSG